MIPRLLLYTGLLLLASAAALAYRSWALPELSVMDQLRAVFLDPLFLGAGIVAALAVSYQHRSSRHLRELAARLERMGDRPGADPPQSGHGVLRACGDRRVSAALGGVAGRLQHSQRRIFRLAFFDPMTGLMNRECLRRRVQAFLNDRASARQAALIVVDLDGFRTVNASLGHQAGDDILGQAGARLRVIAGSDMPVPGQSILTDFRTLPCVARLAADRFAVFLPRSDIDEARTVAERLARSIAVPFPQGAHTVTLGASFGIAQSPDDAVDHEGLIAAAEGAMHRAKQSGKNAIRVFGGPAAERDAHLADMAERFFTHRIASQTRVVFQPRFRARDLSFAGLAARLRWHHPSHGDLPSETFLELLSHLGLRTVVHRHAFDIAMDAMKAMGQGAGSAFDLTFDVSASVFLDDAFVDHVSGVLPLPYGLGFAIDGLPDCEASAEQALWVIDQLREAGVSFQLDGFGSDRASLSRVIDLAPHRISLDEDLTSCLAAAGGMADLTGALVRTLHDIELDVVATSVETPEQKAGFQAAGVDYLQGPALCRPLAPEELAGFLRNPTVARVA